MSQDDLRQQLKHFTTDITTSLRMIDSAYRGFYIRVRRVSDNAEASVYMNYDTGFIDDDSLIDDGVTTIADWIGASTGYIVTWYDLSGKNKHLVQGISTNQPLLVLNGSGTIADILWGATYTSKLKCVNFTEYTAPSTIFVVYKSNTTQTNNNTVADFNSAFSNNDFALRYRDSGERLAIHYRDSLGNISQSYIESSQNTNINLATCIFDGVSILERYLNGSLVGSLPDPQGFTAKCNTYQLGDGLAGYTPNYFEGYIREFIVIRKELNESDREQIEREIITASGIS